MRVIYNNVVGCKKGPFVNNTLTNLYVITATTSIAHFTVASHVFIDLFIFIYRFKHIFTLIVRTFIHLEKIYILYNNIQFVLFQYNMGHLS